MRKPKGDSYGARQDYDADKREYDWFCFWKIQHVSVTGRCYQLPRWKQLAAVTPPRGTGLGKAKRGAETNVNSTGDDVRPI